MLVYVLPRTVDVLPEKEPALEVVVLVDVAPEKLPDFVFVADDLVDDPPENDLVDVDLLVLLFDKFTFGADDELLELLKLEEREEEEENERDELPPLKPFASARLGTIKTTTNINANKTLIDFIYRPLS